MPNNEAREAPVSPVTETRSHDRAARDNALSQALLQILEMVAEPNTSTVGSGSVAKRLRSNRVEIFRGIAGVALNIAEYWIEATERIMDNLDCTSEQKLKVKEGTQADRLTWKFFKTAFEGKYVGASYVDARRREYLNLTQGDKSVAEYESEFLRLNRYARGMVATEYERCVQFEDGLRDSLKILIALQRE
ncbi:uncharacterized protein [Gossypium hirsutum]|uniref:Retrotransposon gag domain-containing protein n=1 Tax=Gossypium hirsutum TaxID=3635 RepID=A0ABM2YNG4_GOSHI|nr:uncharacterized protein LOC121205992 [Gossypium hirsutum]